MISKSDILEFKKIIYDISKAEKFPNSGLSDLEWQMKVNAKICDAYIADSKGQWVQLPYVRDKFTMMEKEKRDFALTFSSYVKDSVQDILAQMFLLLIERFNHKKLMIEQLLLPDDEEEQSIILNFSEYCCILVNNITKKRKRPEHNILFAIHCLLAVCQILNINIKQFVEYRIQYIKKKLNI